MKGIEKLTADVKVDDYIDEYVDIDYFQKLCKECDDYGINWSCPPFDFDIIDYWKAYENLKIIAFKLNFDEVELEKTYSQKELDFILKKLERFKVRLMNDIYALESDDAVGLFLGKCNLCMRCTKEVNMPCKMPVKMRYSLEALGADVDRTVHDIFDLPILYAGDGKLPEYLIFVGGLLYNKR